MSENLWDDVLARVEGKINRHSFATWFRPTSYLAQDQGTLRIGVPNAQFREWLSKNYRGILQEALTEVGQGQLQVIFEEHAEEHAPQAAQVEREGSALNPKYTFDSFVVGAPTSSPTPLRAPWPRSRRRLQPAVHLRRRRPRQDAPAARDRPPRPALRPRAAASSTSPPSSFTNELINAIRTRPAARVPRRSTATSTCC